MDDFFTEVYGEGYLGGIFSRPVPGNSEGTPTREERLLAAAAFVDASTETPQTPSFAEQARDVLAYRETQRQPVEPDGAPERVITASGIQSTISIFPNPSTERVTVKLSEPARITVYDLHGRKITELSQPSQEWVWDLTTDSGQRIAPGLYFLRVETDGGVFTRAITVL